MWAKVRYSVGGLRHGRKIQMYNYATYASVDFSDWPFLLSEVCKSYAACKDESK